MFKIPPLGTETIYKIRPQAHSFDGGPLHPSVYLVDTDVIHIIKWTRPFPLFYILQAIKNWTVGRPENEARLSTHTDNGLIH